MMELKSKPKDDDGRNDRWIRCKNCRHKLMKVLDAKDDGTVIEIKCSSCKAVTVINVK